MFEHNRQKRLELFKQLKSATHNTHTARLSWNLQESQDSNDKSVTASTAGFEAVKMVRELMSQYTWPSAPKLSYTGMRRTSVRLDQHEVDSGVITVSGELRSPLGVEVAFDVPVEIRAGRLLEPSIMIFGNQPRVISQSTIDSVVRDNNTYEDTPTRSIYAAPLDRQEAAVRKPFHKERRSPGLFSVAGKQAALREFIRTKGMKISAQLHKEAGWGDFEQVAPYRPSKQKMDRAIDLNKNQAPSTEMITPTNQSYGDIPIPGSPSTATTLGITEPCKVCQQPVPNDEPYVGTGFCSDNCAQQYTTGQSSVRSRRPPSKGHAAASKPEEDASKPSTSKGEKHAHMNAEEKKTVLYEGSKNPEPVPTTPSHGEKVKVEQPNVEDDQERKQKFMPGQSVKLKKKLSAPTRGGGRVVFNSGVAGTVVRDQAGDGYAVYVMFNDGRYALVPGKYL